MIKTKLPVMVLKNMILLPHGEIRLEIEEDEDKDIVRRASSNNDNYVLLISPEFLDNDEILLEDLPKIGTIGRITSNFDLPNNNIRISIMGVNRAKIFDYISENGRVLDAVIGPIIVSGSTQTIEEAKLRILKKKFSDFVLSMPNISNSIIARSNEESSLEKLTDIIVNILPLTYDVKIDFINEINSVTRADSLLELLSREKEINELERTLENELKLELDKAQKEYILREKLKVIKDELGEGEDKEDEISDIRKKIEKLKAPTNIKKKLNKELKKYENIPVTSPEIGVIRNYIDLVLSLPWGKTTQDNTDLKLIEEKLNSTHFGLEDVKNRIIEYIAVKQLSNNLKSPIICLAGPPGVGKTSLAFSIAEALNRKFVKISVGGVSDEAEIIGHRRTYIGAQPGRIINALKKAKTSNPVFLIDEIDKMTKDIKGDPASSLLEVLDPEQNKLFTDNYLEEPYDLSNVMFILTANDVSLIPYALRDRLEIIDLSSYTEFEKVDIVKKYMYEKLLKEHGLTKNNLSIDEETLKYIIENYTKESGVRELERVLSTIMRKVCKKIVMTKKSTKCKITIDNLKDYLGKEKYSHIEYNKNKEYGIVNGLGYTPYGGEIIPIEVTIYEGKGKIILTGSLGDVMKESAEVALGYIKSHHKELNVDLKILEKNDIHVNAVEGAVPKDGPSAGIALTSAIVSALTKKEIPNDVAMTGEITLKGNVLQIGGLKEKSIGGFNQGIKKIFIPIKNEKDLDEIPDDVKNNIKFIPIENYLEIYNDLFK